MSDPNGGGFTPRDRFGARQPEVLPEGSRPTPGAESQEADNRRAWSGLTPSPRSGGRDRWSAARISATVWAAVAVVIVVALAAGVGRRSPSAPWGPDSAANRATVLIYVDFEETLWVPGVMLDYDRLIHRNSIGELDNEPIGDGSRKAADAAVVDYAVSHLDTLLVDNGTMRSNLARTRSTGSGFILTPDGYLVTNAHVVTADKDSLDAELISDQEEWFREDLSMLATNLAPLTDEQTERLREGLARFYRERMRTSAVTTRVFAVLPENVSGGHAGLEGIPCEVCAAGSPAPGKDVAVLKIDRSGLPTLRLVTDSDAVHQKDSLFVFGYPCSATFDRTFAPASQTTPTMTVGYVNRVVPTTGGWSAIQTDAAVSHGSSGGPAVNEAGEVVGIVTFGAADPETGRLDPGFCFLMPADVIRQIVDQSGARPAP